VENVKAFNGILTGVGCAF